MRQRYFIGLEPDAKTKTKLPHVPESINRKDLHVTLAYLGTLDNSQIKDVDKSLRQIKSKSKAFEASYKNLSDFNGKFLHARVKPHHRLNKMVSQINTNIPHKSKHKFNPHITLNPRAGIPPSKQLTQIQGTFPVKRVHLYRIDEPKRTKNSRRIIKVKTYKLKNRNVFDKIVDFIREKI